MVHSVKLRHICLFIDNIREVFLYSEARKFNVLECKVVCKHLMLQQKKNFYMMIYCQKHAII